MRERVGVDPNRVSETARYQFDRVIKRCSNEELEALIVEMELILRMKNKAEDFNILVKMKDQSISGVDLVR